MGITNGLQMRSAFFIPISKPILPKIRMLNIRAHCSKNVDPNLAPNGQFFVVLAKLAFPNRSGGGGGCQTGANNVSVDV